MSPALSLPDETNGVPSQITNENSPTKQNGNSLNNGRPSPTPSSTQAMDIIGYHEAFNLEGPHLANNIARVVEQSPGLGRNILNGFGVDNLGSTMLSYREWALISLATLIAIGDTADQLNVYVEAALRHGATVEEVLEIFKHGDAFVGAPRAVNALRSTWSLLSRYREPLIPQGYTETVVRLTDHDTLLRDSGGSGVPIILIHALSMDGRMWREVLPRLASSGTRLIAYDLRGHGRARAAPLTRNLEHLCADLELLMNALDITLADVYGASYGGAVAQYFALDYPRRVRSLAVLATAAKAPDVLLTRATRAEQDGMDSLLAESIIRWFLPETIAQDTWCVRYARSCVRRARVEDWAAAWRAMAKLDCLHRLHELTVPVLSLSGKQDLSSTPPMMKAIADACSNANAEFVLVDPGTHMMVMEQSEVVAEKLVAFREKVDKLNAL